MENGSQNPTRIQKQPVVGVVNPTDPLLDPRYQSLIDYKAMNGLITDQDGNMKKMPMQQLADGLGVVRDTLYTWMQRDGFWEQVNERRKSISTKSRLAGVHETWYLRARKGEFQHLQLWLANFDPNFRMPTEKIEHEVGNGFADLIASHSRNKTIQAQIIDISPNE